MAVSIRRFLSSREPGGDEAAFPSMYREYGVRPVNQRTIIQNATALSLDWVSNQYAFCDTRRVQ